MTDFNPGPFPGYIGLMFNRVDLHPNAKSLRCTIYANTVDTKDGWRVNLPVYHIHLGPFASAGEAERAFSEEIQKRLKGVTA